MILHCQCGDTFGYKDNSTLNAHFFHLEVRLYKHMVEGYTTI